MTAVDAQLCHLCTARPAARRGDAPPPSQRLAQLARDENPAVAHVAAAALAYRADVEAWKRLAAGEPDVGRAETFRKHGAVASETHLALAQAAADAKAVSTP